MIEIIHLSLDDKNHSAYYGCMQNYANLSKQDIKLIKIAENHAKKRFKEGITSIAAALRTKRGKVYTGINLKYRVRNTSTCAETMAIYTALDNGESQFDIVVGVKYSPKTNSYEVVNGCGWCRQLYCYNSPLKVIVANNEKLEIKKAEQLLPLVFL